MTNGFKAWVECRHMPKLILTLIWKWKSCRIAERGSRGIIWGMPTRKGVFFLKVSWIRTLLKQSWSFAEISPSCYINLSKFLKNIAKGTTDPRVKFITQVQTKILIKFHLQNLDQASTSKSQPNISLFIKRKLQNLNQT